MLAEDALQGGAHEAPHEELGRRFSLGHRAGDCKRFGTDAGHQRIGLPRIGSEQQLNESDLHFLRRLLARYDADLQVVAAELHATPRSQAQRNAIELDMNSQLHEVRILADTGAPGDAGYGYRVGFQSGTDHLRDQPDHVAGPRVGADRRRLAPSALGHAIGTTGAVRDADSIGRAGPG